MNYTTTSEVRFMISDNTSY